MKPETIQLAAVVLTLFGTAWAIYVFSIRRFRFTFLNISLHATQICTIRQLILVQLSVRLENKGNSRIDARELKTKENYLYNDGFDACRHAGTLKIRQVPDQEQQKLFDWYYLPIILEIGLEQINYLNEFIDPRADSKEVDFWLEPRETYELNVFLSLLPGTYAAKAYFLGKKRKHKDEEYWFTTCLFHVSSPV